MKRKEYKAEFNSRTLEALQQKYEHQRDIHQHQIKRLEKILEKNIEEKKLARLDHEKRQQILQRKIEQQDAQIQTMKTQLLAERRQDYQEDEREDQHLEFLRRHKEMIERNKELEQKINELLEQIVAVDEDRKNIQLKEQQQRYKIENQETVIKSIKSELKEIQKRQKQLMQQSKLLARQLQIKNQSERQLFQQANQLRQDLNQARKKKKGMEKDIDRLQEQLKQFQTVETCRFQGEISQLKRDKEQLQQNAMKMSTKMQFLEIAVQKKDDYINKFEQQVRETKEIQQQTERQLQEHIEQLERENRALKAELQREKLNSDEQSSRRLEDLSRKHEQEMDALKKKMVDEMYSMLNRRNHTQGSEQQNKKTLQNIFQEVRNCKSHSNIPSHTRFSNNYQLLQPYPQANQTTQYKLQAHLENLKAELALTKKQNEILNIDINQLKKTNETAKVTYQDKIKSLSELNAKLEKSNKTLGNEMIQMRNQSIQFRDRESQLAQCKQQGQEFQNQMALKISFYDKKIRDLLQTIQRKQQLLSKTKQSKGEIEQKAKFLQQKLLKTIDENQVLKRYKNDTNRRDQLVKEYKEKIEKLKGQNDSLKAEYDSLKREKNRIEKNIDSKEQYISALKTKHQKDLSELEGHYKQIKASKDREQKNAIDSKNKKLKKQYSEFLELLDQIKQTLLQKVQQRVAKSIPENKKKKPEWQAAKLLGLKSSEIEQFVNPLANMDKNICRNLEQMWDDKNYREFIETSLEYLALKT